MNETIDSDECPGSDCNSHVSYFTAPASDSDVPDTDLESDDW